MNNTTHTPGPWYPHYAKADHCLSSSVWGQEPGNQVAVIGGKSLQTMNANAALIAAAPAMYLELKEGLVLLEASHHDVVYLYGIDSLQAKTVWERIESTRNALAQAEGVSHE